MKINKYLTLGLAFALTLGSCSLDSEIYDQKEGEGAYSTLKDIENSLNGIYYRVGHYAFLGNYATTVGDFCSGMSTGSASSGHMYSYSAFTFTSTSAELEDMWNICYKILAGSTESINAANEMLANGTILESEKATTYNYIGQFHALKALAGYYLVNLYALPYSESNKSQPGIIIIDKEVPEAFATVSRGTVEETYTQITKDIQSAEDAFAQAGEEATSSTYSSAYYMGMMGLQALKARVYLSMGDYNAAETAAKTAITLKGNGDGTGTDAVPSDETYTSMWGDIIITDEDLFTIKKSEDDNLSANSINTLYGSYYATIQNNVISKFGKNDIRASLFTAGDGGGTTTTKFLGKSAAAVCNIPVFRKSEMSLIIAECEARNGNISEAQNYLLFTAKRNKDIKSTSDLPSNTADLLSFISEERIREFVAEGHRFYDARRIGDLVSGDNFQNWDIQKFVFPIPESEINTGTGCQQNENWSDNLPVF